MNTAELEHSNVRVKCTLLEAIFEAPSQVFVPKDPKMNWLSSNEKPFLNTKLHVMLAAAISLYITHKHSNAIWTVNSTDRSTSLCCLQTLV